MVRAKFLLTEMKHVHLGSSRPEDVLCQLTFTAVWNDGKGNESWSKATPTGQIQMSVTNPDAIGQFDLGKFYLLDFTPAD